MIVFPLHMILSDFLHTINGSIARPAKAGMAIENISSPVLCCLFLSSLFVSAVCMPLLSFDSSSSSAFVINAMLPLISSASLSKVP